MRACVRACVRVCVCVCVCLLAGSQLAYIVFTESVSQVKVGPFLSIILFGASIGLGITSEVRGLAFMKNQNQVSLCNDEFVPP